MGRTLELVELAGIEPASGASLEGQGITCVGDRGDVLITPPSTSPFLRTDKSADAVPDSLHRRHAVRVAAKPPCGRCCQLRLGRLDNGAYRPTPARLDGLAAPVDTKSAPLLKDQVAGRLPSLSPASRRPPAASRPPRGATPVCSQCAAMRRDFFSGFATWAVASGAGALTPGSTPCFPSSISPQVL